MKAFGGLEKLKSNATHFGKALVNILSGEHESSFNHSCAENFTTKAGEFSMHTLEGVSSMFVDEDPCNKGQAKALGQMRSTLRNFFSRRGSAQNQLVLSEGVHDSGVGGFDDDEVLFELQRDGSNGPYRIVGLHSKDESAKKEIEIVFMPQDGPASLDNHDIIPDVHEKEESLEVAVSSDRKKNSNSEKNATSDTDAAEIPGEQVAVSSDRDLKPKQEKNEFVDTYSVDTTGEKEEGTHSAHPEEVVTQERGDSEIGVTDETADYREEESETNLAGMNINDTRLDSADSGTREPEPTDIQATTNLSNHSLGSENLRRRSLPEEDPSLIPIASPKNKSQHEEVLAENSNNDIDFTRLLYLLKQSEATSR